MHKIYNWWKVENKRREGFIRQQENLRTNYEYTFEQRAISSLEMVFLHFFRHFTETSVPRSPNCVSPGSLFSKAPTLEKIEITM